MNNIFLNKKLEILKKKKKVLGQHSFYDPIITNESYLFLNLNSTSYNSKYQKHSPYYINKDPTLNI